ncbi:MAG: OmpA family protein [Mangrovibacterium sp.]
MKTKILRFSVIVFLLSAGTADAQILEKIGKRAQKSAERTVERRIEKESSEKTDDVLDKVFENDKKTGKKKQAEKANPSNNKSQQNRSESVGANDPEMNLTGTVIFSDDFNTTPEGDFPGKFISSSGGEIVRLGAVNGLKFYPNSNVVPNLKNLPDNFALEFDLTLENVPPSLYRTAFNVYFQELDKLKHDDPKNKYGAVGFSLWGDAKEHQIDLFNKNASYEIEEKIPYNVNSNIIDKTAKLLLLKNGTRLRLFINGQKILDSPNLLQGVKVNRINFRLNGTKKDEHSFIISNLKVTSINDDLRTQLIEKGEFTTNNILFASGSDKIQPSSYNILNEIADAIKSDASVFQIIGHTDSDGEGNSNLALSKKRAESVKDYLVSKGISASRLQTEGKGENEPVVSNSTPEGKAQNRRVEFKRK